MTSTAGAVHIGIGGWDYEPWRGTFYPAGLAKAKQLEHASRRLSAIEINATYYKLQKPELYERWAATVPEGFKFAVKGSRFCSNRKVLAEGGAAVERFCGQGFTHLGSKLGPILWQLMETKRFEPDDIAAFLALLPGEVDGVPLRHALEARHESFRDPRFAAITRDAGVAIAFGDAELDDEPTADFVYCRLRGTRSDEPLGFAPAELDRLAGRARAWAGSGREVFLFFIAGAKEKAPAAAQALIERLGRH